MNILNMLQRYNQKLQNNEGHTTQRPKEKQEKHHEPHKRQGVNLGVPEGLAVPGLLVTSATQHHLILKYCWTSVYVNKYK